ncbi:MAG: hypothetical protein IKL65_05030 [Bacilli bacterium]|nr:hypothetical protein [Bacilli bacterium]
MNKLLKILCFMFVLFLVGCSKERYIVCKVNVNNDIQDYNMTGTYKIYYNNSYVTKIEKEEVYTSSDLDIIEYFNEAKNLEYYNLNDLYSGYIYTIKKDNESVKLNITVDMNLVDIKKMIKDKYLDKDYVISNKLTTSGIVKIYESRGAICDI